MTLKEEVKASTGSTFLDEGPSKFFSGRGGKEVSVFTTGNMCYHGTVSWIGTHAVLLQLTARLGQDPSVEVVVYYNSIASVAEKP